MGNAGFCAPQEEDAIQVKKPPPPPPSVWAWRAQFRLGGFKPVSVAIFGASGKTGVECVRLALERGWTVTAFCRTAEKLALYATNSKLTIVTGDAMSKDSIKGAIASGMDACLVLLGSTGMVADKVSSTGTKNVILEMKSAGVKKLVVVTAMGVGDSERHCPPVAWANKNSWLDKASQEKSVRNSELDWVIIRPGTLNDLPARGPSACVVVDSMGGPIKAPEVSRSDLAAFALDQCPGLDFNGKCPGISWKDPPPLP